mgnify:CR=1 FL=1
MKEDEIVLSPEGLRRLEKELEHLKSVKRKEIAARIREAREFGDISENAEYENAKNEQAFLEGRILKLENLLRNARLMDELDVSTEQIGIGTTVKLRDLDEDEIVEYTIVSSAESDPSANKISYLSPVGKALMGKKVGDVLEIKVPAGILRYEVLELSGVSSGSA